MITSCHINTAGGWGVHPGTRGHVDSTGTRDHIATHTCSHTVQSSRPGFLQTRHCNTTVYTQRTGFNLCCCVANFTTTYSGEAAYSSWNVFFPCITLINTSHALHTGASGERECLWTVYKMAYSNYVWTLLHRVGTSLADLAACYRPYDDVFLSFCL